MTRRTFGALMAVLLIAGGLLPMAEVPAAAVTKQVSVPLIADTYADFATPNSPHGGEAKVIANGSQTYRKAMYLAFDASALPAGTVQSATLSLTRDNIKFSELVVRDAANGWSEASLTWNNRPTPGTTEIVRTKPPSTATTATLDVTSALKGPGLYTFVVETSSTTDPVRIWSKESGQAAAALSVVVDVPDDPPPPPPPSDGKLVVTDVPVAEDSYVAKAYPSSNYGTSQQLVANGSTTSTQRMLLKFDASALPAGQVVSAQILVRRSGTVVLRDAIVATMSSNWSESAVTWAGAPADIAPVGQGPLNPRRRADEIPVTGAVKGPGIYAFSVSTQSTSSMRLQSRETGAGPVLRVTTRTADPGCSQAAVTVSAKLVPSCGILWGAAADAKGVDQGPQAHRQWEQSLGMPVGLYSHYYEADYLFPTQEEIDLAREPGKERVLLMNWRVAKGMTWADVVAGRADARIDAEIAYLKSSGFTEPFFLTLHQEPELEVIDTAGSGMTAADFAAMYRYVVDRFRAQGVTNAVMSMAYLAYPPWVQRTWFADLWPGDQYVDWISWDPYAWSPFQSWSPGNFEELLNLTTDIPGYGGFYKYITTLHPDKPLILGEWGMYEKVLDKAACDTARKAGLTYSSSCVPAQPTADRVEFLQSVKDQLPTIAQNYPQLKAMVYFASEPGSQGPTKFWDNSQLMSAFNNAPAWSAFQDLSRHELVINPGLAMRQ